MGEVRVSRDESSGGGRAGLVEPLQRLDCLPALGTATLLVKQRELVGEFSKRERDRAVYAINLNGYV